MIDDPARPNEPEFRGPLSLRLILPTTYVAINAAAHNPVLTETYRRLNMRVQNLRYKSNVALGEWSAATSDHEDFVAALLARDGAKTEALLRQHVLEKRDFAVNEARARETSGD